MSAFPSWDAFTRLEARVTELETQIKEIRLVLKLEAPPAPPPPPDPPWRNPLRDADPEAHP